MHAEANFLARARFAAARLCVLTIGPRSSGIHIFFFSRAAVRVLGERGFYELFAYSRGAESSIKCGIFKRKL